MKSLTHLPTCRIIKSSEIAKGKKKKMTINETNTIYEVTQALIKYMNGKELGTACEHCPYCDENNDEQEECLSCACYEISLLNRITH